MEKTDRQLAQLFKRARAEDKGLENMPQEYRDGWYDGAVAGREAQRNADVEVAKRIAGMVRNEQT